MKDFCKVVLDGKNRKLLFKGDCFEVLDFCEAICCREWNVFITEEEFQSGLYKVKKTCVRDQQGCGNKKNQCLNRVYQLEKKTDGSCFYLDNESKCSIYNNRPKVCREFNCKAGWKIASLCKTGGPQPDKFKEEVYKSVIGKFNDEMEFLVSPLIALKTIFYSKEIKKATFVLKPINKCTLVIHQIDFDNPKINEQSLLALIKLFDGRNDLKQVLNKFNEKLGLSLSKDEFYKTVGLLYINNILIFKNSLKV